MSKNPAIRFLLMASIFAIVSPLHGQVENDLIDQRIGLVLDESPMPTTTRYSTVETDCINKTLTKACLVYHNDQWFTFTVPSDGRYYLNVASQECTKSWGIQVLVIEGDPCEINTYRMIQCIPKVKPEDTYVVLDSLKQGIPYLLNIDGFLGDYCSFTLQLATRPSGLPLINSFDSLTLSQIALKDSIVTLSVKSGTDEKQVYRGIDIYRNGGGNRNGKITSLHVDRQDSRGKFQNNYVFYDTLKKAGKYTYTVYGIDDSTGEGVVLLTESVIYGGHIKDNTSYTVKLPVKPSKSGRVVVRIIHAPTGEEVGQLLVAGVRGNQQAIVNLHRYIEAGYNDILLELLADGQKKPTVYFCRATPSGVTWEEVKR